jgi:hypothetical protein
MIGNKNGANGKGRQRAGSPNVPIDVVRHTVLDLETGLQTTYFSISEAAKSLNVPYYRMYFPVILKTI